MYVYARNKCRKAYKRGDGSYYYVHDGIRVDVKDEQEELCARAPRIKRRRS